jgi:hypothetical protein
LAVLTTGVDAAPFFAVDVVVFFDELESLDPPHAASAIAPAAPRATSAETLRLRAWVRELLFMGA